MGYKHSYDIVSAAREINAAAYECADPRNDGFVAFGVKQDLYRLKWILEDALRRCPKFSPEDEWLREQDKQKVIRILKDEL
jgi:hypothetical protein